MPNKQQRYIADTAAIISTPTYREVRPRLEALFRKTRVASYDPQALLDIQIDAAALLSDIQEYLVSTRDRGDLLGQNTAKRLFWLTRRIMDGVAWRVSGYNRVLLQLLSEHNQTGHPDDTVVDDLNAAKDIGDASHDLALVNDLTHILRFGDVTVFNNGNLVDIIENKSGQASANNRRARKQKRELEEILAFLRTSTRERPDNGRDYIVIPPSPLSTYHSVLAATVQQAKKQGYAQTLASDVVGFEVIDLGDSDFELPNSRPFQAIDNAAQYSSLQLFDVLPAKIAPYGIFPIDSNACFEVLCGEILIITTLNLDALVQLYKRANMQLVLPPITQQESASYVASPIDVRKQLLLKYKLRLQRGTDQQEMTVAHLWPLAYEGISDSSLVASDQELLRLYSAVKTAARISFYSGFKDEQTIWS